MSEQQQLAQPPPYRPGSQAHELPTVPTNEPARAQSYPVRYGPVSSQSRRSRSPRPELQDSTRFKRSPISPQHSPRDAKDARSTSMHLPAAPTHSPSQASSPQDSTNAMKIRSQDEQRAASASIEDPDDRMAAEALCGLGKVESNPPPSTPRTLTGFETPLQYYPIGISHTTPGLASSSSQNPEPLLSLLTSSHPWLGGTLNGSLSAYSTSKSYTPRIVQYGADLVENTVGSVGRATGVEGSIRRYLEPRDSRSSGDLEPVDSELVDRDSNMEISTPRQQGRKPSQASSVDSLPLYDDNRSPAYSETTTMPSGKRPLLSPTTASGVRSWPTQLMISTSGLGAALNDASLRSLKTCLALLSNANAHLRALMEALKRVLADYDAYLHSSSHNSREVPQHHSSNKKHDPNAMDVDTPTPKPQSREAQRNKEAEAIAARIRHLNSEIWSTLKTVVNTVSRHTGGALPENASVVVRWQLMSVPTRWKRAVMTSKRGERPEASQSSQASDGGENGEHGSADKEKERKGAIVTSAHAMLAFAVEGLEMIDQVGGVVESTIGSAERWLDSMGRRGAGSGTSAGESGQAAAMSNEKEKGRLEGVGGS